MLKGAVAAQVLHTASNARPVALIRSSTCQQTGTAGASRADRLGCSRVLHASVACLPLLLPCSLLCLQVVPGVPFFASRIQLGPEGVAKINGLGPLTDFEKHGLDAMIPELKAQIDKGLAFAKQ